MLRSVIFNMALSLLLVGIIALKYRLQTESVVLHYNVLNGIDVIGNWRYFLVYPAAIVVLTALNASLVASRQQTDPFLIGIIVAMTSLVGAGVTIAFVLVVSAHHTILP